MNSTSPISFEDLVNLEAVHALLTRFGHPDVQFVVNGFARATDGDFFSRRYLLANTYSKSLLRTVAQQWTAIHQNVHYFPSCEIVLNPDRAARFAAHKHVCELAFKRFVAAALSRERVNRALIQPF
ncbi:MAG: hypothetical protein DME96_06290 [Verrucomicrobia bacterium]|nr:MAG: hypothetical protein DME96_06290 [Verrucomicrobiota bacterium]